MGKKRIHELAKELSMTSNELIQRINELKLLPGVKLGASNSIDDVVAEDIKSRLAGAVQATSVVTVRRRKKGPEGPAAEAAQDSGLKKAALKEGEAQEIGPQKSGQSKGALKKAAEESQSVVATKAHRAESEKAAKEVKEPPPPPVKRPVKINSNFDKATIIGVQSPKSSADSKKMLANQMAEKAVKPDYLKLPPAPLEAVPVSPKAESDKDKGASSGLKLEQQPKKPELTVVESPVEKADSVEVPPLIPASSELSPHLAEGRTKSEKGSEKAQDKSSERRTERTSGARQGQEGRGSQARAGEARSHRGDKPEHSRKVTRELGTGQKPFKEGSSSPRDLKSSTAEPAKVVGMAKPWTGSRPGSTGSPRFDRNQGPAGPGSETSPRFRPLPTSQDSSGPGQRKSVPGGKAAAPRGEQTAMPPSQTDGRKRGDRKKKGGSYADRQKDESGARARHRELVERTDLYSEGTWERARSKKSKSVKKSLAKTEITTPKAIKRRIKVDEAITVSELAHRLSLKSGDIIKKLMSMGVMASLNQSLDFDTATLVASEFGYEVEKSSFDEGAYIPPLDDVESKYQTVVRPPVVTIMGHVDHGKTSLLDYIRKTKIQEGEAGGITQHIGAYHVKVADRFITFLDTPGHEAFTAMRSRGAKVTDLVILIVAADDGVMPQTREAADHARAAKVPILVAVNKIDKPGADPERIRRQMMELGLTQESWGGNTVFVDISAKTGQGVDELLEMILLQADLLGLKARNEGPARGRIIEARLDKGRGAMATVLVSEGFLKQGDPYVCGVFYGKIRALFNDQGQRVENAGPAIPVEIQGISGVPLAGDEFIVLEDERQARQVSQHRLIKQRESELIKSSKVTLENLFDNIKAGAVKGLNLIIKADVQGSLEAILDAVGKLSTLEIKITIIHSSTGTVSETDIMLASASKALIICFNVKPLAKVQDVADAEQVQIRCYDVIYQLLDDIKEAMAGLLDPVKSEKLLGQAEVRALFVISKVGQVAGSFVHEGKIIRGARARVYRGKDIAFDGRIGSLKREKLDVREVAAGYECGICFEGHHEIQVGDRIECYQIEETAATVALINEAVERAAEAAAEAAANRSEVAGAGAEAGS
jgi:translation initiation factor IF-2